MDLHLSLSDPKATRFLATVGKRLVIDYYQYVVLLIVGVVVAMLVSLFYGLLFSKLVVVAPTSKVPALSHQLLQELTQWRAARAAQYKTGWTLPDHDYFIRIPFKP